MDPQELVFLFDVDNTLLDNDRVTADLMHHLELEVGLDGQRRYRDLFEELRVQLGYADYLGALQRYRMEYPRDFRILETSSFLVDYPFATRLYPDAIDVVERCQQLGQTAIVSDGDVVFQPIKIKRSGLMEAFGRKVLIYIHKEQELDDVAQRYPADHYLFIDDKLRILSAVKRAWGPRVTTVFPLQGHYARDEKEIAKYPAADVTIERIGLLANYELAALLKAAASRNT